MKRRFLKSFFLTPIFFSTGAAAVFICAFGFVIPPLLILGKVVILLLIGFTVTDAVLLFNPKLKFAGRRITPRVLGIGDTVKIVLELDYEGSFDLEVKVIDELPVQLQERNFGVDLKMSPGPRKVGYEIRPVNRGIYSFGDTRLLIESPLRLVRRLVTLPTAADTAVYPSILQMRETGMMAFSRNTFQAGTKKLNRMGQSYEFEQITPFVEGDDYRNINWKATGKTRELMVNQFQDERSQNLYCVISKGRAMKLTFNDLSLLDYAINATLALSNVALKKYDKVGLISFSDKIGTALRAENRKGQLQKILESLYAETERDREPGYELLYRSLDRLAKNRSLVILFANFETPQMLDRAMPILQKISKKHLLVTVLFKDAALEKASKLPKDSIESIYSRTLAEKYFHERNEIAKKLRNRGIHTITGTPEELSVNTINRYLELKSRGMI